LEDWDWKFQKSHPSGTWRILFVASSYPRLAVNLLAVSLFATTWRVFNFLKVRTSASFCCFGVACVFRIETPSSKGPNGTWRLVWALGIETLSSKGPKFFSDPNPSGTWNSQVPEVPIPLELGGLGFQVTGVPTSLELKNWLDFGDRDSKFLRFQSLRNLEDWDSKFKGHNPSGN